MNLKYKIGAGLATAAFLGAILAPAAFAADNTCEISGNGNNSRNRCRILVEKKKIVVQKNFAHVENSIGAYADTGGNSADRNVGGNNSVDTGNATVTVTVTNNVNTNNAPPAL